MPQRWPLYRQSSPYAAYIAGDGPLDSPELFSLRDDLKAFLYELIDEADLHQETIDILHQVLAAAESERDATPEGAVVKMILYAALRAAESEHAAARACCDAHASILPTPIHILPFDVMTRVFHLIVPPLSQGPWWLMHVCRRWRAFVMSCPTLWASFSIGTPYIQPPHDAFVNEEPLLRALEYSHPAPLTFHAPIHHLPIRLLNEFLLSSPRWRVVSLDQCMALDLEESLILPDLEALTLCDYAAGFTPVILNLFTQTPNLRNLKLGGMAADEDSFPGNVDLLKQITSNFPWTRITELSVALDHSWMSYLFLSACPNLVSFRDNSRDDTWEDREHWPVIALIRLRALHTRNAGLFQRLRCPCLDKLSFPARFDLVDEISTSLGQTASDIPSPTHVSLGVSRMSRNASTQNLLTHLNTTRTTDLTIRSTTIPTLCIISVVDLVARNPHFFPSLLRLHIQLEHLARTCEDDDCEVMFGGRLGGALYEIHIRNSFTKMDTVSVDVSYVDTTSPPFVDEFFSALMELKPSGLTYRLSTSICGSKGQ